MNNLVILEDPIADALGDLAALGKLWARGRKAGRMPSGIRSAMLLVAQEAVALLDVDAASAPSTTKPCGLGVTPRRMGVRVPHERPRVYRLRRHPGARLRRVAGRPGAAMTEAIVWPTFTPNRACLLCDHGRDGKCIRPEVRAEFEAARRQGGACGPEARFLTIKGLDYSKEIA